MTSSTYSKGGTKLLKGGTKLLKGGTKLLKGGTKLLKGGTKLLKGGTKLLKGGTKLLKGGTKLLKGGTKSLGWATGGVVRPSRPPPPGYGPALLRNRCPRTDGRTDGRKDGGQIISPHSWGLKSAAFLALLVPGLIRCYIGALLKPSRPYILMTPSTVAFSLV